MLLGCRLSHSESFYAGGWGHPYRAEALASRHWPHPRGNDSPAELLGIFQVSILHNIVHLLFGVAGLALSRTHAGSLSFLLWGGVIYLVLFLYGLFIDKDSDANFVPVNTADSWLHLLLGAGLLGGWFVSKGAREGATDRPATTPTPPAA